MNDFIVYYIVGQPRSGSTFVGDHIARRLNIVNAGEVWQTLRTMDRVKDDRGRGPWHKGDKKRLKSFQISSNPFWYEVLERNEQNPYYALVKVAASHWDGLVDCSKTDVGIESYRALGCKVVVVHTLRAFTTWQASLTSYRKKYGLPVPGRARLLLNYIRLNRRYRGYRVKLPYKLVPQEQLKHIGELLDCSCEPPPNSAGYLNAEMFGSPGFVASFNSTRSTTDITRLDKFLYTLLGVQAIRVEKI